MTPEDDTRRIRGAFKRIKSYQEKMGEEAYDDAVFLRVAILGGNRSQWPLSLVRPNNVVETLRFWLGRDADSMDTVQLVETFIDRQINERFGDGTLGTEIGQTHGGSTDQNVGNRESRRPPLSAEFLFHLFMDAKNCDAIVGDLEERYKLIFSKFGKRKADFWYWTQAIRSVGPIARRWGTIAVKKLSGLAALVELYRRMRS